VAILRKNGGVLASCGLCDHSMDEEKNSGGNAVREVWTHVEFYRSLAPAGRMRWRGCENVSRDKYKILSQVQYVCTVVPTSTVRPTKHTFAN
jgi:hypothetical protein